METMRTTKDCGIVAEANATGKTYEEVLAAWPTKFKGNDDDSNYHHRLALKNLGFDMRKLAPNDLLSLSIDELRKVVVLLHNLENPTLKHWVTLDHIVHVSSDGQPKVYFHDGTGNLKMYPWQEFIDVTMKSWPDSIFMPVPLPVSEKPKELRWYQKLWVKLTGWI